MTRAAPPTLSLVIPVYNVAPFLAQCLDSLLAQTRPAEQIIIVDDGSTDDGPEILRAYAARCPAITVIRQDNQGLSGARNSGLARVTGDYLAFVDSDDFLAPDCCEKLLAQALAHDADIVLGNGWYHFDGREADYPIYRDAPIDGVISGAAWLAERLARRNLLHMVWLHLYRTAFLRRHDFRFVPRLIHEDVIWTNQVLLAAQRVVSDAQPHYYYRIRVRHFTPEQNDRRLLATIDSSLTNAATLEEITRRDVGEPRLRRLMRWQLVEGGLAVFHKVDQLSSAALRRQSLRALRSAGYFARLWRNATEVRQRRRIARNYLRSLAAGVP